MPTPIREWIYFIPGHLQDRANVPIGLPVLAHEFSERYSNAWRRVEFNEWNSDWNAQAEWVHRLSFGVQPTILVVAYSWGVGYGLTRFAKQLRRRGLEINHVVASDGICHIGPRWWSTRYGLFASQLLAFYPFCRCADRTCGRPKLRVPDNVRGIDWFVQNNARRCERLRGHELVWQDGTPCPGRHDIKYRTHASMDECPEFWERAREVARHIFG